MKPIAFLIATLFFPQALPADAVDAEKHIFYLHGAIIEKGDPRPLHPEYGLYDYPAIISRLSEFGFNLISERRALNTDYHAYAGKVAQQINDLVSGGVDAKNITVIGFSKGAAITAIVSSLIKNDELNFVIMANCGPWYESKAALRKIRLRGHIFSIYEESDPLGRSCEKLAHRTPAPSSFSEVAINTGKSHGAFFLPDSAWVNPVVLWVNREAGSKPGNSDRKFAAGS